jgi:NTP pyrophosphatase (non-canonical NTP hydrolase)
MAAQAPAVSRRPPHTPYDPFDDLTRCIEWLDNANGRDDTEITLRIVKVMEEAGEAAAAIIGMTGQNPRKGIAATREELLSELADVIIAALVAAGSVGADPLQPTAEYLRGRLSFALSTYTKVDPRSRPYDPFPDVMAIVERMPIHRRDPALRALHLQHAAGWAAGAWALEVEQGRKDRRTVATRLAQAATHALITMVVAADEDPAAAAIIARDFFAAKITKQLARIHQTETATARHTPGTAT